MDLLDWIGLAAFAGVLAVNVVTGLNGWRAARRERRRHEDAWVDYPLQPERCRD
jgi:hypothetical protein